MKKQFLSTIRVLPSKPSSVLTCCFQPLLKHSTTVMQNHQQHTALDRELPTPNYLEDSFPVAKSHSKPKYMQPPKLDRHGNPVWDYTKLKAFDKSKYPAIENPFLIIPKKKRHEWRVRNYDETLAVEFKNGVKSEDFHLIGAEFDEETTISEKALEQVKQIFSYDNASKPDLLKRKKLTQIYRFQKAPRDTGSTPVQIAVLTERIKGITDHLKINTKDYAATRRLQVVVNRRKKLMKYLKKKDPEVYWETIRNLDIKINLVE
ncbi:hypothetical protein ABK040_007992 [Willaertia magna]